MPEVRGLSPVRDALWQGEGGRLSSKRHVESLCCMLPSPMQTPDAPGNHVKQNGSHETWYFSDQPVGASPCADAIFRTVDRLRLIDHIAPNLSLPLGWRGGENFPLLHLFVQLSGFITTLKIWGAALQVRSGDHNCAGVDVGQLLHEWRS